MLFLPCSFQLSLVYHIHIHLLSVQGGLHSLTLIHQHPADRKMKARHETPSTFSTLLQVRCPLTHPPFTIPSLTQGPHCFFHDPLLQIQDKESYYIRNT